MEVFVSPRKSFGETIVDTRVPEEIGVNVPCFEEKA
jgi:hypothetical protein